MAFKLHTILSSVMTSGTVPSRPAHESLLVQHIHTVPAAAHLLLSSHLGYQICCDVAMCEFMKPSHSSQCYVTCYIIHLTLSCHGDVVSFYVTTRRASTVQ